MAYCGRRSETPCAKIAETGRRLTFISMIAACITAAANLIGVFIQIGRSASWWH